MNKKYKGRGFMNRMKETWNEIYEYITVSAHALGDNDSRKTLMNVIKVRDEGDLEPETRHN